MLLSQYIHTTEVWICERHFITSVTSFISVLPLISENSCHQFVFMWQCPKHYLAILTVHSNNFLVWASICLYTPYADAAGWFPSPDHCRSSVLQTIVFSCTCCYSDAVWVWILVECKMKYVSEELPSVWFKFKWIPDKPHNENLYNARVPELVRQWREHTSSSLVGCASNVN